MNIGFDLDKVIIGYPPFIPARVIDRLYKKEGNLSLQYRIPNKPEQLLRIASHHPYLRRPINQNLDFIREISQAKKHNYYLISSRFGFLEKTTNQLIKRYKLDNVFKELLFNFNNQQPHLFKDLAIKKLQVHHYVDDDLPLLRYIAAHNPQASFYWLNNKLSQPVTKNINAITHLSLMFKDINKKL